MYSINWTKEKKQKAIELLTMYFEDYGVGECIMQSDDAIIYAPDLLSKIADDILVEGEGIIYNEIDYNQKQITMTQQTIRTKVETYRIDKKCEKCKEGIMYGTGSGVTQWHSYWEHKCNKCGHIESYENISYPHTEYVDVKHKNK